MALEFQKAQGHVSENHRNGDNHDKDEGADEDEES